MSIRRNNFLNNLLYDLSRKVLANNAKFKNRHKGESCYVFGNGASIKYMDLEQFDDRIGISCGVMFLHRDFKKLNVKYYYTGHPFFYYPYWTNPYSLEFEKNRQGSIYKRMIYSDKQTDYFVSLTNYYGISGTNIHFLYHFDEPIIDINGSDLTGKYTFMDGALTAMVGLCLYMGFEDIILVGCDYVSSPILWGHFYEYGKRPPRRTNEIYAEKALAIAHQNSKLTTVTIDNKYKGVTAKEITYKNLTNMEIKYKENYELVDESELLKLNKTNMGYRIFPQE